MGRDRAVKTSRGNGAESRVDQTRACTPLRSYKTPKNKAATASTSMAQAYSRGSVSLFKRPLPERRETFRDTCMEIRE